MTEVKICGVRTAEDAAGAAEAGASLVGFNFWPRSARFVAPAAAAAIALPAGVLRVGLFVDPTPADVLAALEAGPIDLLQFHGDEPPEFCRGFRRPFMKAFRLRDAAVLDHIPDYLDGPDHPFLVDAWTAGGVGGTGVPVDLDLARRARDLGDRCVLAGGLTAETVGAAIRAVRPWAVDVASGVERAPGVKDASRMGAFVAAVRLAEAA